ncbi:cytochrome b5 [Rhizodiscina lignyota]|uniref:Cytochrome b5 n=1 Tax=Rhizodiscina lignyota TaxID=1504668 RepID=A0A9P4I032_9PEZI|nr:cytochrome b5 [Rhizodiscina lignyota]
MEDAKAYSLSEVSTHKSRTDVWIAIHGKVYNVSKYLDEHPGGIDAIMEVAGSDATTTFEDVGHSEDAREVMEQYFVGTVEGHVPTAPAVRGPAPPAAATVALAAPAANASSSTPASKPTHSPMTLLILGVPAAAILGYQLLVRMPGGHSVSGHGHGHSGGFWTGFLISSTLGTFVLATAIIRLEKAFSISRDIGSFPTHITPTNPVTVQVTTNKGVLNPKEYQRFPLARKEMMSPNVCLFVFRLPTPRSILGLPIGQHIAIRATVNGKQISRSYTPVSNNTDKGELRLAIKLYSNGQLTGGYLANLQIGDEVEFRGPKGTMRYRKGHFKQLGMICGGTGITPMFQLIRAICEDPADDTNISLLFANATENDIIMRDMLEEWRAKNPKQFKVWYKLDHPPEGWTYGKGYIAKDDILTRLPPPAAGTQILLCGPPGMVKGASKSLLELGYEKPNAVSKAADQVFLF